MNDFFLGFDCSTQSFKVIVIDCQCKIIYQDRVIFAEELDYYGTKDGIYECGNVVLSPVLMWIEALDIILSRMKERKFPFYKIKAISGSAQQHTAVYWNKLEVLKNLHSDISLSEQLNQIILIKKTPIWMDNSTTVECREFESVMGGAQRVADITGSKAYERFTGMQIKKLYKTNPTLYNQCERISLLSSFFTSLLIQDVACMDYSDAAGMNLMNIYTKDWDEECLQNVAPNLRGKLGTLKKSHTIAGNIGNYFVEKYKFNARTQIVRWTGDNPSGLAGLCLNCMCINMGTSDTIFGITKNPSPSTIGHVFPNPIDPNSYMVMICFKNADLTRKKIRGEMNWNEFSQCLISTPLGNNGKMGFYYDFEEITPANKHGYFRFDASNNECGFFEKDVEVRALIEGQCLAMHTYSKKLEIKTDKIFVSGGTSTNMEILNILGAVYNCPIYCTETCETSLLGAAYRAIHGYLCLIYQEFLPFNYLFSQKIKLIIEQKEDGFIYDRLKERAVNNLMLI